MTHVEKISRHLVPDNQRLAFLPKVFGLRHMLRGESMVYQAMRYLCANYDGGCWHFYELNNGGFYLAPNNEDQPYFLECKGNGFSGSMSADAVGITATLFAIGHMLEGFASNHLVHAYHALRDYALQHPERISIMKAID